MAKKTDKTTGIEIETDEQAAVEATPESTEAPPAESDETEGLVNMHKDGTTLHVHPTTVKAHEQAGWKVA